MDGIWLFLAVLGAPLLHAPVLRWDLLPALGLPLDGGATLRGRRVLGANKTLRGALCMVAGCTLAALLLSLWPWWWDGLPRDLRAAGPLLVGVLVGVGIVIGELPNSFAKRQLDIAPGAQRRGAAGLAFAALDQFDLVLGVFVALLPVWVMPLDTLAVALVLVSAVHLVTNVVGHRIGARSSPV